MLKIGNRKQVINGIAKQTGGGLQKKDLKYNKFGKIVSKKISNKAKKENKLQKAGYYNIKGQFGLFKMKGGININIVKIKKSGEEIIHNSSKHDHNTYDNNSILLDEVSRLKALKYYTSLAATGGANPVEACYRRFIMKFWKLKTVRQTY